MIRSAIYARVSTVTHTQQHTIEEQIDHLRARILSCGGSGSHQGERMTAVVTMNEEAQTSLVHL